MDVDESIRIVECRRETTRPLDTAERFRGFCESVEPGLRRALVAAYGLDAGRDAAADALSWAWEHFGCVETMTNPGGYLYRVGQTAARRNRQSDGRWMVPVADDDDGPLFEPGLAGALASLTPHQRAAVLLVHGHGYSLSEASQQLGCRIRTLRNHLSRGLQKLRTALGVETDDAGV